MQRVRKSRLWRSTLGCLTVASLAVSTAATADCFDPNTCYGTDALFSNTFGVGNSGFGYQALYSNTTAHGNTANGHHALYSNTTGNANTASGSAALESNTDGSFNTAVGGSALFSNTVGESNTALGAVALYSNNGGSGNTASGVEALYSSTSGNFNAATGYRALVGNTTGWYNTASGYNALASNLTGNRNTAYGASALINATGSRNVALGENAGYDVTTGRDNIIIGAGQKGKASDSGVIRIGASTLQNKTHIAGIRGVTTGKANAVPVMIDSNGQLGTISSSRRVKDDIQPMGSVSERLLDLRPVTFRYKQHYEDGSSPVQFGLVAEEVAQVFPELVVYGEGGEPETVSYHLLSTLLLNELQNERRIIKEQAESISMLQVELAKLTERLGRLEAGG